MPKSPTVLIFLKAPRPGFVKTRLARDLGEDTACRIYRHLAETTLATIPPEWQVYVSFTPADASEEMITWLGEGTQLQPQTHGDLGARLANASAKAFQNGASSILLLGGDCPDITTQHLEMAASHLSKNESVIGPARDGGYWLLGLPTFYPEIFQDIPWSSGIVLTETLKKFTSMGLLPHQLETLEDIDDASSWSRALQKHPTLSILS